MILFLKGAGWCGVYLGSLFGVIAGVSGETLLASMYLVCALAGWAAVRATEVATAS